MSGSHHRADARPRLGAVIVTYESPEYLAECLAALRAVDDLVDRVIVVDNSRVRDLDAAAVSDGWPSMTYEWDGVNRGLPAAIGEGIRRIGDVDATLVLDDDTVLDRYSLQRLVEGYRRHRGIIAVPLPFDLEAVRNAHARGIFAWSPSIIGAEVVDAIGLPRAEYFFGWDDWEYGIRAHRAGFARTWITDVTLPRRIASSYWPGRAYLSARNIVLLMSHGGWRVAPVRRRLRATLRLALRRQRSHPLAGLARRGLVAGVARKHGPPPAWVLEGRSRQRP